MVSKTHFGTPCIIIQKWFVPNHPLPCLPRFWSFSSFSLKLTLDRSALKTTVVILLMFSAISKDSRKRFPIEWLHHTRVQLLATLVILLFPQLSYLIHINKKRLPLCYSPLSLKTESQFFYIRHITFSKTCCMPFLKFHSNHTVKECCYVLMK